MIGTWHGYYKYDNIDDQKASGFEKTFFTITISTFSRNEFKGTVVDDVKTGGMEGTGQIIGTVDGQTITFKKFMPKKSILYPNGEQKYSEKKHPTLYYEGKLSSDEKEINGNWKFKTSVYFLFGFIPIPYRPGSGTWKMALQ